jgi:hypothetical protein
LAFFCNFTELLYLLSIDGCLAKAYLEALNSGGLWLPVNHDSLSSFQFMDGKSIKGV